VIGVFQALLAGKAGQLVPGSFSPVAGSTVVVVVVAMGGVSVEGSVEVVVANASEVEDVLLLELSLGALSVVGGSKLEVVELFVEVVVEEPGNKERCTVVPVTRTAVELEQLARKKTAMRMSGFRLRVTERPMMFIHSRWAALSPSSSK
jgi:hypothetical protein